MHLLCASHKAGIRPQDHGFWNLFHYVNSSKKGLQNRHSYAIILVVPSQILGCRQAVRHQTLTLAFVGSNPAIPAKSDPLAQLAEQLPFKQWVRGSNPRRVTKQKEVIAFGGGLFSFRWSEGIRTHSIKLPVAAWKPPAGRGFSIVYSNPRRVTKNRQALFGLADFYLFTLHFSLFTRYRGRFLGSNR